MSLVAPIKPIAQQSFEYEIPDIYSHDHGINVDFEENSPNQEGNTDKVYQRPDKSYFQEPQDLQRKINTDVLAHSIYINNQI